MKVDREILREVSECPFLKETIKTAKIAIEAGNTGEQWKCIGAGCNVRVTSRKKGKDYLPVSIRILRSEKCMNLE